MKSLSAISIAEKVQVVPYAVLPAACSRMPLSRRGAAHFSSRTAVICIPFARWRGSSATICILLQPVIILLLQGDVVMFYSIVKSLPVAPDEIAHSSESLTRDGNQATNSLELLACLLNDSAYRFRRVLETWRCI